MIPTAFPNETFLRSSWAEEEDEWWSGAAVEDTLSEEAAAFLLPEYGGDLFVAPFPPPPPRPAFLDIPDEAPCDLCGWAWQEGNDVEGDLLLFLDGTRANGTALNDTPQEFGWVLALIIVSIVSAVIGAIIMVTVIQCRNRLKDIRSRGVCSLCRTVGGSPEGNGNNVGGSDVHGDDANKGQTYSRASAVSCLSLPPSTPPTTTQPQTSNGHGVWAWLTTRRSRRYDHQPSPHVERRRHYTPENHYTLSSTGRAAPMMPVGVISIAEEALYAELDPRDEDGAEAIPSPEYEDPSYQNMAYQGSVMDPLNCRLSASSPLSSSSAYYSDLSTSAQAPNGGWEATYEAVDADPRLPSDVHPNAVAIRPSDNEIEMTIPPEAVNSAVGLLCVESEGEDHVACNNRHHICSLPVTKTVPSDYV
ncbi:uncharacterized protein LOC124159243 [Ischnura elegans]|uniref:uncharacterized protein LOC124159243 n=1 Tax=Ischnura elegans TaxID=197161 RepID=UPI001ED89758|nr:uncharacterized protein LOC124159243 [Ischnura elegans]